VYAKEYTQIDVVFCSVQCPKRIHILFNRNLCPVAQKWCTYRL